MILYRDTMESPIGLISVIADDKAIRALDFEGYEERLQRLLTRHYGDYSLKARTNPCGIITRLTAYFDGDLRALDGVEIATNGTPFQKLVWAALLEIPPGNTVSYGTIAERVGQPKACRAVGLANGSNPIGIIVPCHRVIGANAKLTGYGGGLDRKQWLLRHEGAIEKGAEESLRRSIPIGV